MRRFSTHLILLLLSLLLIGCASEPKLLDRPTYTSYECSKTYELAKSADSNNQLDIITELFKKNCSSELIFLANHIQNLRRDKFYSLTAESAELFTPEGSLTPYILESYERSYLSLLVALSYLQLNQKDHAMAELRRSINEENAMLYNYGNDPVIQFLQAALWDHFDTNYSRPLWRRINENSKHTLEIRQFAGARMEEIDAFPEKTVSWKVWGVGQMPQIDWKPNFLELGNNPYSLTVKERFPASCSNENSALVSTKYWTDKISKRYDSSYHPVLLTKYFLRLPVGLGYGLLGVSAGVAVGFGGCAAAAQAKGGAEGVCEASIKMAGAIIGATGNLVDYTLQPDLRRWKRVPIAFMISRDESAPGTSTCGHQMAEIAPRITLIE